jgi:SPP1 family predicted phage head-tail adaptor
MVDYSVSIADLRKRITFQSPTESKDAGGAQRQSYANIATNPTVWSKWVYDHGQENVQGDAVVSVERATVTVRYRSDVLSTWQVVKDSVNWKIISPPENVQNENRWTVFRVERVKGTV